MADIRTCGCGTRVVPIDATLTLDADPHPLGIYTLDGTKLTTAEILRGAVGYQRHAYRSAVCVGAQLDLFGGG